MDNLKAIPEKVRSKLEKPLGLAAIALTTMACSGGDLLTSPEPLPSFARGLVGTALLATELFGTKPLKRALFEESSPGKAVAALGATVILPVVGGAVGAAEPAVSCFLFYTPIVVGFLYLTGRSGSN